MYPTYLSSLTLQSLYLSQSSMACVISIHLPIKTFIYSTFLWLPQTSLIWCLLNNHQSQLFPNIFKTTSSQHYKTHSQPLTYTPNVRELFLNKCPFSCRIYHTPTLPINPFFPKVPT